MFARTLRQTSLRRTPFATGQTSRLAASSNYTTTSIRSAKKGAEDRDSISTESTEYSKSGGDGAASTVEDAAFSPDKTRPEEQYDSAKKEAGGESENPLSVSPANQEISKPKEGKPEPVAGSKSEAGSGGERARTSGGSRGGSGGNS
ncbi:unnamed protein product [Zymoseptoria tritici ST99CH_1E4]|uniref:Uncharacterized protein n=1 Tax=Zymoseptoria tritici ST99CH_1E4 TaxID=1276532 RepID=A0A2H1FM06_ZYMTR|nr:unnamed protein product [Zymoseptoria tritici ST99CH_1E4]